MNMVYVASQMPRTKLSDAIGGSEPSRSAPILI
jgi:hypothetical protein